MEYDASGTQVGLPIPLGFGAPLGITIDNNDNKWIAHRLTSGVVSRVDSAGVVTNFAVSGGNPVRPIADFRAPGRPGQRQPHLGHL